MLVARFLIEDNTEPEILFDENATNEIAVVRSILRSFLGNYTLMNDEMIQKTIDALAIVSQNLAILKASLSYRKKG